MQAEVAGLRVQTERQDYLIAELRHALYGKRSEQLDADARQLAFEDLETAVAEAEAAREALTVRNADGTARRPTAKRNLGHLPDHLPRIEQVIEPEQRVYLCNCTDMVKIGEGRAERLDIIPARFQVIVTVRPRYACHRCDVGILQAETPDWLIEGGLPTEGTLAHVAVYTYADHLPLYRQCQIYGRGGVDLDRSFAAHDEGGHTWARMGSLIESCKMNAVNPYAYLRATLTAIANRHPASRIDDLMPWEKPSS